jgi:hypothetical protein
MVRPAASKEKGCQYRLSPREMGRLAQWNHSSFIHIPVSYSFFRFVPEYWGLLVAHAGFHLFDMPIPNEMECKFLFASFCCCIRQAEYQPNQWRERAETLEQSNRQFVRSEPTGSFATPVWVSMLSAFTFLFSFVWLKFSLHLRRTECIDWTLLPFTVQMKALQN